MNLVAPQIELPACLHPHTRLLLHYLQPHQAGSPGALAQIDTDALLHLLDSHRLSTIFYQRLPGNPSDILVIKQQLAGRYATNKMAMLARMAELCRILKLFAQNGIHAIALKGPLLGHLYYNDYTLRECKDLDILVKPADTERAFTLLTDSGYELTTVLWKSPKQKVLYTNTYYHYNLYNTTSGIQVELHWRLNLAEGETSGQPSDPFSGELITQQVGGQVVHLLSATDNFIYLCVHGSTHEWKRLFWVYDIAQISEKEGAAFLAESYRRAAEQKLDRYVLAGCYMAAQLFGTSLPAEIRQAIRNDSHLTDLLSSFMFSINHVGDPYQPPLSSVRAFRLSLKKLINYYRITYYFGGCRSVFAAGRKFFINPDYWNIFAFSDRLFVLNYAVAPFLWIYSAIATAFARFDR